MLRSQGDNHDVAIYRSLSQIPTLRKIHLSLYCSQALIWNEDLLKGVNFSDSSTMPGKKDEIAIALGDMTIDERVVKRELADLEDVKFASALQRVWPNTSSENWKNEWHSFPLQA
jgi:hypothetical protein